jgi:hypothetical protein
VVRRRVAALLVALGVVAVGCTEEAPPPRDPAGLVASVASYDLAADSETRFLVGLLTEGNLFVSGGAIDLRFSFLGETEAQGQPQFYREARAEFMPLPFEPEGPPEITAGPASQGRGVYVVESFEFDRPGFWEVEVTAPLPDGAATTTAAFQVLPEPVVPTVGERAPRTENLTLDSDAREGAIDSRAETEGQIPDLELHRTTIADAIADGRPVLAVFSTPVYCVSQFCGPITDMISELEAEYGERAAFVHVEVWHDFAAQEINEAAADWLLTPDGDLTEPWVFLIGEDGRIRARWDNVATRQEIEPWLKRL